MVESKEALLVLSEDSGDSFEDNSDTFTIIIPKSLVNKQQNQISREL
jgi:hypothetical protein